MVNMVAKVYYGLLYIWPLVLLIAINLRNSGIFCQFISDSNLDHVIWTGIKLFNMLLNICQFRNLKKKWVGILFGMSIA